MKLTLDHIQIAIPPNSEPSALEFYRDILGLASVPKPAALLGRGGLWFDCGGIGLHLGVEDPFRPSRKAHPGFRVTSLAQSCAKLAAADIEYVHDVDLPGIKRVHCQDPFGNRIELLERVDPM